MVMQNFWWRITEGAALSREQGKSIMSNHAKLLCDTPVQQLRELFSMEGEFEQIITKIRLSIKENNN